MTLREIIEQSIANLENERKWHLEKVAKLDKEIAETRLKLAEAEELDS